MIFEIIKLAFNVIVSNKLRSFLSMLGVIIGVITIILVFAIGKGAQVSIEEQYKSLSVTTIMIMPARGPVSSKLSADDVYDILDNSENIANATAIVQGNSSLSYSSDSSSYSVLGVTSQFDTISNLKLHSGKMFTDEDDENKEKVVVLGMGIVEDFFEGNTDLIGEEIVIDKKKFTVIGIFEASGTSIGPTNYDESMYIPFTTAEKQILGSDAMVRIVANAKDVDSVSVAMEEMTTILRTSHKLKTTAEDDFMMRDQGSRVVAAQESAKTMEMLLIGVATVVFFVSGIGIMNVMFAGVAERTKEIGIMKSIGATRGNILGQFLIESILLTFIGGVLGIGIGEGLIPLLNGKIEGLSLVRDNIGTISSLGFAVITGVFFGYYPAYKASLLDPVDALRV